MKEILDPLKAESLKDVFIARFEEAILSGKLSIGQSLPSERELAQQLGVSRPVVHQGLMDLEFKGLVKLQPRVGATVGDFRSEGSLALLTSLFNYRDGHIEPQLLDSMLEVRLTFETRMARLACANRTDVHLAAFRELLDREKEADLRDVERIAEIDFAVHHQVAIATANLVYPLILNSFKPIYTNLTRQFFSDAELIPLVFEAHKHLVSAIDAQDGDTAVRIMEQLLAHGERHLKRLIDQMNGRPQ